MVIKRRNAHIRIGNDVQKPQEKRVDRDLSKKVPNLAFEHALLSNLIELEMSQSVVFKPIPIVSCFLKKKIIIK